MLERLLERIAQLERELRDCDEHRLALKQAPQYFDLLSNSIEDNAVVALNPEGLIEAWNVGAEKIFGWKAREAIGRSSGILFVSEDIAKGAPARELERAVRGGPVEEDGWHRRKDGSRFWASGVLSPVWGSAGNVRGFLKIMRDCTARRTAEQQLRETEEQLRESEERFRLFVENVEDYALIQVDPEGRISGWNIGAQRAFGYLEGEILGKHMVTLFTPVDAAAGVPMDDLRQALHSGRSENERWLVRKDGSLYRARWVTVPMRDAVGALRGYARTIHDETARRSGQDRNGQALNQKNALVQEMNHHVKNNLQVVGSLLSARADRVQDPRIRSILDKTRNRVGAIGSIHERLSSPSDFSSINFRAHMERLVRDLFRFYVTDGRHITLNIRAADVVLDVQQCVPLGLIVNELVVNALKHAFPNRATGRLGVSFEYLEPVIRPAEGHTPNQGPARLTVSDDGIGLPRGIDIHAAQSMGFHRVDTLCRQLAGKIGIDGPPGTTITITFPLTLPNTNHS
jgi:PAS domain S-box-containing protein